MEEDVKKPFKRIVIIIAFIFLILIILHFLIKTPEYYFKIDGKISEIVYYCDDWNYSFVNNQMFCIFNDSEFNLPLLLPNYSIDYSMSPQENCHRYNATFPGFSSNDSKAKEIYDRIIPICHNFTAYDINDEFLKEIECIRGNKKTCEEWRTGGLIIKRRIRWF